MVVAAAAFFVRCSSSATQNAATPRPASPPLPSAAPAAATPVATVGTPLPEAAIDLSRTPTTGAFHAPIEVVEYSDFLCPHCRAWGLAFHGFLPRAGDRVSLHYKFYPLDSCHPDFAERPLHPGACWLAFGGVCAEEQGRFWPYHDRVLALGPLRSAPDRAFVVTLGGEVGLDTQAFDTCVASPGTRARVVADIAEGTAAGVTGTPTIFVNRRKLARLTETEPAIDAESKRLGLGPIPAP